MNKNGFIDRLAKRTELSSGKAKVVTEAMIQIITE